MESFHSLSGTASPVPTNREFWNRVADEYQREHGDALAAAPLAWGVWRIPESETGCVGDVAGLDVLELGCGAGQWAMGLAALGARVVGLDLSERQLAHARRRMRDANGRVSLVQASAEALPFADGSFDRVLSDHGAMTFARPGLTVPEVARVLRPGGRFLFCHASPIRDLAWDASQERMTASLQSDYFDLGRIEDEGAVLYQLPYGSWVRLFRSNRLRIEDLIELRPAPDAVTSYDWVPRDWARRWPAENLWNLVREP